jgi:hypothetical protein
MAQFPADIAGRYEVTRTLAEAGGCTTFLARDRTLNRDCVLKAVALDAPLAREARMALEAEAERLRPLQHPQIPSFTGMLDQDGWVLLLREYKPGECLQDLAHDGRRFEEQEVARIALSVLEVLAYLHGCNPPVLHLDICPANVVLDPHGRAHLIDFAHARVGLSGLPPPATTTSYIAPERMSGSPVDASDLYSLGMVMVFLLSGKDPLFLGQSDDGSLRLEKLEGVSATMLRVLARLVAREPAARYPAVREAAADLRGLSGRQARAVSLHAEPDRPRSRLAFIIGGGVIVVAGLAAAGVFLLRRGDSGPAPAPVAATAPVAAKVVAASPAGAAALPKADSGRVVVPDTAKAAAAKLAKARQDSAATAKAKPPAVKPAAVSPAQAESPPAAKPRVVGPVGNTLTIDIYRDFRFVEMGFPAGLGGGQTAAGPLTATPRERLTASPEYKGSQVLYGALRLGNGSDPLLGIMVEGIDRANPGVYVDINNNENLCDDGPPLRNAGTGGFATTLDLQVEVLNSFGAPVLRPYQVWLWLEPCPKRRTAPCRPNAWYYATCYYEGTVMLGGRTYKAVAYEYDHHQGLFRHSGVWIDANHDGKFDVDKEHVRDGQMVRIGAVAVRLALNYP